mgnify:CR=1 FL=1
MHEILTNKWYNLVEDTNVVVEWNETTNSTIENELRKAQVKVIKIDKDNNEIKLEGVKFDILDEKQKVLETIVTDKNGEALTSKYPIRDFQKIYIREAESLENYVLNDEIIEITLEENKIKTAENVMVTVKTNEQVQEIAGWTLSEDKLSLNKTYTINTKEQIEVKDLVGNVSTVEIKAIIKANLQINNEEIKGEWIYNIGANVTREDLEKRIKADADYVIKNAKGEEVNRIDIIGTGTSIEFTTNEKYTFVITGDLDGDGKTTANDLLKMKRQVVGMKNYELQGAFKESADTNLDKTINVTDLLRIKRAVVGLIEL